MTNEEKKEICAYIDLRLSELEKRVMILFDAKDHALSLSTNNLEKRLESMNEFRAQIKDERAALMPRSEYVIQHQRLIEDIQALQISKAILDGRASVSSVYISYLLALIGIVIAIISELK